MTRVVVVHGVSSSDNELEQTLERCAPDVRTATLETIASVVKHGVPDIVLFDFDPDQASVIAERMQDLPETSRIIVVGDPRQVVLPQLDCVLFPQPDEETLRCVLGETPQVDAETFVRELLPLSLFGSERSAALQEVALRMQSAFASDDCLVALVEDDSSYSAQSLSDNETAELVRLSEVVCQFDSTVIAPPRPDRPYRAFLGVPLSLDNAPPVARVLLCRAQPIPWARETVALLRTFARRLATDLAWRIVHDKLVADSSKLRELSRIDPVLGVANRAALQEELLRRVPICADAGEPFTVAVIDVDGLRIINERHGYPAGDAVLAHIAQIAHRETQSANVVARYASDSVAIAFPGQLADAVSQTMTRILSAIDATPVTYDEDMINLTVSAGIAEIRYDVDTGETALARAMAARDRARFHGDVIRVADDTTSRDPEFDAPDFEIGRTLGGVYQIRHEINRGSFGVVYRAEDLALGRQVAVKLLRPDLTRDESLVENFRREAATLAKIRNPNLVQVYSFGTDGPSVYFAMELVEGQGLDVRIASAKRRRRHFPVPEFLRIIEEVTSALEAVHRVGMLHRDVKPENVLVDRINRRCVLVDVGIAVRRGEKSAAGTPGFTAPEVFGHSGDTASTDVYSLGVIAYLLLTLEQPFVGATPSEILMAQLSAQPSPLTALRADLPPDVDRIILAALDPDPARRPQSARELFRQLQTILAQPGVQPRQTIERNIAGSRIRRVSSASQPAPGVPLTRGVLFRAVHSVLGVRRGSAWLADIVHRLPELAPMLSPQSSPLSWYPTGLFVAMLDSLGEGTDEPIAFQIGQVAIDASFRQFFGADPTAVSPERVLGAADVFLRSYHSWCSATTTTSATHAEISWVDGIVHEKLCASFCGMLSAVVVAADGRAPVVDHRECRAAGAKQCVFKIGWESDAFLDETTVVTLGAKF